MLKGPISKRPSPFIFPGGSPGFDPNHPASRGLSAGKGLSVIAVNGNIVNLLNAKIGAITGSPTKTIKSVIGPATNFPNSATVQTQFSGFSTAALPAGITQAGIVIFDSVTSNTFATIIDSAPTGTLNLLGMTSSNVVGQYSQGQIDTTFVPIVGVPYFIAASLKNSSLVCTFVITNLLTGKVFTQAVTCPIAATTPTATCVIGGSQAAYPLFGSLAAAMYSRTVLSPAELLAWANDPWSFWYPNKLDLSMMLGPSSSGISGTLATTEIPDTASFNGSVLVSGILAATEAADTAAFNGSVLVSGTLAVTEGIDTAAFNGFVGVSGTLATTETTDIAAFNGDVIVSGPLAVTEGSDIAAFNGSVIVSGTLVVTESTDTAVFNGTVGDVISATLAVTDTTDTAAFAGSVLVSGTLSVTDTPDTASFNGSVLVSGTLSVTDSQDTAVFNGTVASTITGTLAVTEPPDIAYFVEQTSGGKAWRWLEGIQHVHRAHVPDEIKVAAAHMSKLGGEARAKSLTATQRSSIASTAAKARWK